MFDAPVVYYELIDKYPLVKDDPNIFKPGETLTLHQMHTTLYECVGLTDGQMVNTELLSSSLINPYQPRGPQCTFFVTETRRLCLFDEHIRQHRYKLHTEFGKDDLETTKRIVDASNLVHIVDGHITNYDSHSNTIQAAKVSLFLENLVCLLSFENSYRHPAIHLNGFSRGQIVAINREALEEVKKSEIEQLQFEKLIRI